MASEPPVPFATELRAYRLAAGLSQEALAERAGLSAARHQRPGARPAPARRYPHTVRRLARALRLTAADRARLEAASRRPTDASRRRTADQRPPTNLPLQVTSFVGREREMAEIARLLATTRLLTLTGAGGVRQDPPGAPGGAPVCWTDYPDGVWLVELAPLADPALVGQAVAGALGVRETAGPAHR